MDPIVLPRQRDLPSGTSTIVEFRGADSFDVNFASIPLNSNNLDAYGELKLGSVNFHTSADAWTTDIGELDGARYFQMRYTLISNTTANLAPEITSVAVAYEAN